jgi:UDP-glucose:(glucosyl)LPS alpha-1,2-glucosyltransferase
MVTAPLPPARHERTRHACSPRPARVALLLPERELFTPAGAGAVALAVRDLALAAPAGSELVVFGRDPHGPVFGGCTFRQIDLGGVAPLLLGNRRAYTRAARNALLAYAPDLVQVHNRPRLALALAEALAPTPIVLALHNLADTMDGSQTVAEKVALERRLDAIVCNSNHVRERFLDGLEWENAPRVLTIHRGLPLSALPKPLPTAKRNREILFVGRLSPDKGADTFVQAAGLALSRVPGWSARMIGPTWFREKHRDSEFTASLRPAAAAAGITMTGFMENDAALRAMAQAAIVVVPSRWVEPFARVVLEALACGAALIASPRGGIPEAAGDAALYVDPSEPVALAEAICRVALDDELRADLQARALMQAARFDIAETAARWADLRARLLAGRII